MLHSTTILWFAFCLLLLGCTDGQQSSTEIATAEGAYDQGLAAFEAGDFQLAEDQLSRAIDVGGLNPDLTAESYLLRAESRTKLGKLDDAMADVTAVEEGAPDLARFHQVRGNILLARGDKEGAKNAYEEARRTDRTIKLPDALR
ncbi:MAG: tetratricopeptide repeat protein [Planctomycetaceae bacterium]